MSSNILVADDSDIIQKVVSVTLAKQDFDLVPCKDVNSLMSALKGGDFGLILLDYNLSDELSGQELLKKIRDLNPTIPIALLLGTFDTVEDAVLSEFGIADKLMKPFNNQLLVQTCHRLCDSSTESSLGDNDVEETLQNVESTEQDDEFAQNEDIDTSGWVVDSQNVEDEISAQDENGEESWSAEGDQPEDDSSNTLQSELKKWGMEVPQVIGESRTEIALVPPVISSDADHGPELDFEDEGRSMVSGPTIKAEELSLDQFSTHENPLESRREHSPEATIGQQDEDLEEIEEEVILPEDEDLSYPDLSAEEPEKKPQSKLISLDELQSDDTEENNFDDDTDPGFSLPQGQKSQLQQEIEADVSPEDFWAAEVKDESGASEVTVSGAGGAEPFEVASEASTEGLKQGPAQMPEINEEELLENLKTHLSPLIEKWLKEHYRETIERVAWEVIPDLAENLIRKEIQSISESFKSE